MKPILILSLLFLMLNVGLKAQDGPNIVEDETHIIPENPTAKDSIYLATWVVTANLGEYFGYELHESDTLIMVEACYFKGFLTQPKSYYDTIALGQKKPGNYKLKFIAYGSLYRDSCTHNDTNSVTMEFEVQPASSAGKDKHKPNITCYPNPLKESKLNVLSDIPICAITIVNMRGCIVYRRNSLIRRQVAIDLKGLPKGVYLLRVVTDGKTHFVEKIMHL